MSILRVTKESEEIVVKCPLWKDIFYSVWECVGCRYFRGSWNKTAIKVVPYMLSNPLEIDCHYHEEVF